jgi:hypothetical protein
MKKKKPKYERFCDGKEENVKRKKQKKKQKKKKRK